MEIIKIKPEPHELAGYTVTIHLSTVEYCNLLWYTQACYARGLSQLGDALATLGDRIARTPVPNQTDLLTAADLADAAMR